MDREKNKEGSPENGEGEGNLLLNMGKIIFLIAVLGAFWYFFDKWLSSK